MQNYEVLEKLGSGSYGDVYKAFDRVKSAFVAIKKFKKSYGSIDDCKWEKELQILTKLNHINVVTLKKIVYEQGKMYLVMDLGIKNLGEAFQSHLT